MEVFKFSFVVVVLLNHEFVYGQLSKDKDTLLNWCLDSMTHKHKPGKEDSLHGECLPWKDHSCCNEDTTDDLHNINMYNFTLDHCYNQTQRNMSKGCRKHFFRNNCFYECEPNIGLWVVETTRVIAKQRFYQVPLCKSDCDDWFDACRYDYTCVYNWPRNFKFKNGHNYCPNGSQCYTFETVYKNAQNFCENVWDESFVYTPDEKACMRIWFNSSLGNPNRIAAEYYIKEKFGGATSISPSVIGAIMMTLICILFSA